jgi:hypothetical protein
MMASTIQMPLANGGLCSQMKPMDMFIATIS